MKSDSLLVASEGLAMELVRERRAQIEAAAELQKRGFAPIMGGAPAPVDSPTNPLGPPTVSGANLTVDMALNQPTRVTRMIMDLTLQRFIIDRIFAQGGAVSGGSVVYDQAFLNQLYTARDVEKVAPGSEFPVLTDQRIVPQVAEVEKWGGKVWIPDEARDRNSIALFTNRIRRVSNTVVRKINQRAIQTLEDSITSSSQSFVGNNWQTIVTGGSSQSNATLWPAHDFARAQMIADQQELGVTFSLWLLNPQEYTQLITVYGPQGLQMLLDVMNISLYSSNRVAAGTAYVVAQGQVGEVRVEKPLGTETWREPETERTWVQASVRPVMYVTDPYSVLKFTGLAG